MVSTFAVENISSLFFFLLDPINLEYSEALCRCILGYENQIDWLQGSTNSCSSDKTKNTATLTLTGKPDPNFKNHKPDDVVQLLKQTFDQFPLAQINLLNCRPKATEKKNGCVDFKMACNLLPDSLNKGKIGKILLS